MGGWCRAVLRPRLAIFLCRGPTGLFIGDVLVRLPNVMSFKSHSEPTNNRWWVGGLIFNYKYTCLQGFLEHERIQTIRRPSTINPGPDLTGSAHQTL